MNRPMITKYSGPMLKDELVKSQSGLRNGCNDQRCRHPLLLTRRQHRRRHQQHHRQFEPFYHFADALRPNRQRKTSTQIRHAGIDQRPAQRRATSAAAASVAVRRRQTRVRPRLPAADPSPWPGRCVVRWQKAPALPAEARSATAGARATAPAPAPLASRASQVKGRKASAATRIAPPSHSMPWPVRRCPPSILGSRTTIERPVKSSFLLVAQRDTHSRMPAPSMPDRQISAECM